MSIDKETKLNFLVGIYNVIGKGFIVKVAYRIFIYEPKWLRSSKR